MSTVPVYQKDFKAPFKLGFWQDVYPEEIQTKKFSNLSFVLVSNKVSIISIYENTVVFVGNDNAVLFVKLTKELRLFKNGS